MLQSWGCREPTAVFLPGKSHGERNLEGYSPPGLKESDRIEQLRLSICPHCYIEGPVQAVWSNFATEGLKMG